MEFGKDFISLAFVDLFIYLFSFGAVEARRGGLAQRFQEGGLADVVLYVSRSVHCPR